jgi:disulfide bond formation protein DsbB
MFPITAILAIALWRDDSAGRLYALTLASIGLLIAAWHSGLYSGLIAEPIIPCSETGPSCTDRDAQSVLGLSLPYLSMASFFAILLLLLPKGPAK